jgi:antitoxin CptB
LSVTAAELGRLRWRCRRGMRELDVLLVGYLERHYREADDAERAAFEGLLELPDPTLADLCFGRLDPPPRFGRVLARLIRRRELSAGPAVETGGDGPVGSSEQGS